jgi:hypothetical protein
MKGINYKESQRQRPKDKSIDQEKDFAYPDFGFVDHLNFGSKK